MSVLCMAGSYDLALEEAGIQVSVAGANTEATHAIYNVANASFTC